ncbi:MAG: hypothetical protein ACD_19C00426G0124 [uncultured bacterium]|nr:MAG: hypothetical protein ACD_19C00426G0124 [uncultured bacterium]
MNEIESRIRQLKIPQLQILKIITENESGVSSSKEIGDTTGTSLQLLGAMITPLRRIKIDNKNLIIPAGREVDNSVRWQLNNELITRNELKALLTNMNI